MHPLRFISDDLRRAFVFPCLAFLLFMVAGTTLGEIGGGLPTIWRAWRFEIPLLLYLYAYGLWVLRPSRLRPILAAVPPVLIYAVFEVYYLQLGRLLRMTEVSELPEAFQVMPPGIRVILFLVAGLPLLGVLASVQWRKAGRIVAGALPLVALAGAVEGYPDAFMTAFEKTQKEIFIFSDAISAAQNGRVSMALYNEARRKSVLARTTRYRERPLYLLDYAEVIRQVQARRPKRNVHLVVLESFFDPELFRKARYSKKPAHPAFVKRFQKKAGFSISPVFGGGTAQAEFELLCGVPALRELAGVEFNLFTGAKTPCLPLLLARGGYHTIATNSFRPEFFNSVKAYEGVGFEKIYYPREYLPSRETYLSTGDLDGENYIFDGDLLTQNLKFIKNWAAAHPGEPLFNYVISMYGHTPSDINLEKRPPVIALGAQYRDDQFLRAVNQYYYRTEAIAMFVQDLIRIDPKSLIILVSDHLPPLGYGPLTYEDLGYLDGEKDWIHLNRIFFIENGRAVRYDTIHHYDVPHIILNYVTRGKAAAKPAVGTGRRTVPFDIVTYREAYMSIMAQAMNGGAPAPDFENSPVEDQVMDEGR